MWQISVHARNTLGICNKLIHFNQQHCQQFTPGTHRFAPHQIQRLNPIGSLVNLGDAGITHILLQPPFRDVAMTAEHLLSHDTHFEAAVGAIRFGNRNQQRHQPVCLLPLLRVRMKTGNVELHRRIHRQRATGHDVRPHRQQHPSHIRVNQNRISRTFRLLRPGRRPTLDAFPGIVGSSLV